MAVDTAGQARTHLDLKSAQLSVVAMVLKTVDVATVAAELAARSADDPEFFDNDPVLIDLSAVQAEEQPIDFAALVQLLRSHRTQPVAVRGGNPAQMQAAHAAGLTEVLLPFRNKADLDDVPEEVREAMTFHPVSSIEEVIDLALEPAGSTADVVPM